MAIKRWVAVNGMKIKVGNKKADLALKIIDNRIKNAIKEQEGYVNEKRWLLVASMDSFISGMQVAFCVLHDEVKNK